MANGLYDKGRQKFLEGAIAWLTDDIRAILIDLADYTENLATDEFLDDIAGAARVAVSAAFGSKTSTDGVADAADITWSAVTGDVSEAIVIYKHTGVDATSPLLVFLDTGVGGLPVTPAGDDITVRWDDGANKIFKL